MLYASENVLVTSNKLPVVAVNKMRSCPLLRVSICSGKLNVDYASNFNVTSKRSD